MNPDLNRLQPYPFERLAQLKQGVTPPPELAPIALSIGEPQDPTPPFIGEVLQQQRHHLANYPTTKGGDELRQAIGDWLTRRYRLPPGGIDPEQQILPVNGTREALFAFAQAVIDRQRNPLVVMPNPFYQIYEGAALLAGAEPKFLPATAASGYLPDFAQLSETDWRRCQLLYLCSPANPTGQVHSLEVLQWLLEKAAHYGFTIAADECYAEIYADEAKPPPGLLQAALASGNSAFHHCMVFHSLSKRSNAPGLRSGFVAGEAGLIAHFLRYRTYHGCAMPLHHQLASAAAWRDEAHVVANRQRYREKFAAVQEILGETLQLQLPPAGFYLWPRTPISDTQFARELYAQQHVTLLPGSYLSREVDGSNPGARHLRIALVAPLEQCREAAWRIRRYVEAGR